MRCRVILSCTAFLFVSTGRPGRAVSAAALRRVSPAKTYITKGAQKKRMRRNGPAMSDAFEKEFSDYLDSDAYDKAEDMLFSAVRAAYIAGWKAAGGDMRPSFELLSQLPDASK